MALERAASAADWVELVLTGERPEEAVGIAFLLGMVAPAFHWVGLLLGGALVALAADSLGRALQLGLYLGVVVQVSFLTYLFVVGALSKYLAMGSLMYLSVAIAVLLPTLSAGAVAAFTAE